MKELLVKLGCGNAFVIGASIFNTGWIGISLATVLYFIGYVLMDYYKDLE